MRTAASLSHFVASRQFCLAVASTLFIFAVAGCGGSSSKIVSAQKTTPTITWPTPAAITSGTPLSSTELNATANVGGTFTYNPAAGTVPAAGTDTLSVSFTPTDTASYTTASASVQLVVNPAPVTVTSVTIAVVPSSASITVAQTLTCTGTVNYSDGTTSGKVGYTATNGTITSAGLFTPTSVGPASCTATATEASAKSATAAITVTAVPLPNITGTSIPGNVLGGDWSSAAVLGVSFTVTDSASTDVLYQNQTDFNDIGTSAVSSTGATAELSFGTRFYSPGWLTFAVCENANGTNCGTSQSIAFLGNQNYLAASSSGELFFLDQAQGAPDGQNGYVRKYKANGTADGSFFVSQGFNSIAVDNKTGDVLLDAYSFDESGNGSTVTTLAQLPSSSAGVTAVAADNGYSCLLQSANNSATCYDLTLGVGTTQGANALNLGITPWAIAMGTLGSETDAYVVSADGTPSLYKVRASDAYAGEEPALPLPGITPLSTVKKATLYSGGLQVVMFDSGPASGIAVVLSTYDQLLVVADVNAWTVTKSIPLSGTPFRITKDVANGRVLVEYANPATKTSAYAWVDVSTGTVTPSPLTSPLLGVGVHYDGTNIIPAMRNQPSLQLLH